MSLSFSRMRTPWLMLSLGCKILYYWPAVGWIEGEVVKRNVDRRMKIGSDSQLLCFVLNRSNSNKDGSPEAPHGAEKGMRDAMRETRVEWTEFTWLLITYV